MSLYSDWVRGFEKPVFKWEHYLGLYEHYFNRFRDRDITVLEIGVLDGGSLGMWSQFFGPRAQIIGIDINENCKQFADRHIAIEVGDQTDFKFLNQLVEKYGIPDLIIDDGSHRRTDILKTLEYFHLKMPKNSMYFIEDCHTAFLPNWEGSESAAETIFDWVRKQMNKMHEHYFDNDAQVGKIGPTGLHVHDSIIAIEYGVVRSYEALQISAGVVPKITQKLEPKSFYE